MSISNKSGNQLTFEEQLEDYENKQKQKQQEEVEKQKLIAIKKAKKVSPINEDDHVKGSKDALITLYEYSDFECPFCKRFYKTPSQLVDNNDGLVNTVFRHFPLGFHDPLATKEALASECAADQGKFWEYHDELFERTKSNGRGLEVSELYVIANDLGLNSSEFKQCLDSEKHMDKIKSDTSSGVEAGVTGTPGNIIKNNKTGEVSFVPGAYPIESLQEIINELK
jgi:protein-disulfide isomerase